LKRNSAPSAIRHDFFTPPARLSRGRAPPSKHE
jgi:hypothetical protein